MKPLLKLNSIALSITTLIVFTIWTNVFALIQISDFYKILLGGIISLGIYRLLAGGIIWLFQKSKKMKKYFLGGYYLEGTWVGFYIGVSGKERFMIERFEQELDSLVIRGMSFDENIQCHSHWTASNVNIDIVNGKMSYMHITEPIKNNTNTEGVAIFNFKRKGQNSAPTKITGFSADIHLGKRARALGVKISDSCDISDEEALKQAIEVYKQNKDSF